MLTKAKSKGWRVVVFTSRGCGDNPVTTPQFPEFHQNLVFYRHALLFEEIGGAFNIPLAASAKSVRDFDEGLTRVSFGFKSVDEYYPNASSCYSIKHVQTPLLCIQAANDPIAPSGAIPREDIKENPNCMLIVTPKGGHLGWVTGVEAPLGAPWSDCVVMNFLEHLERGALKTAGFSCDSEAVQHSSKGLHRIEVQQANY